MLHKTNARKKYFSLEIIGFLIPCNFRQEKVRFKGYIVTDSQDLCHELLERRINSSFISLRCSWWTRNLSLSMQWDLSFLSVWFFVCFGCLFRFQTASIPSQSYGNPATGINQAPAAGSAPAPARQRVRARRGQATDPHSIAERVR